MTEVPVQGARKDKVLLVAATQRFLTSFRGELFARGDFAVELATGLTEAIGLAKARPPTAVVIQHAPPDIDALDLCQRLRANGVTSPLLALLAPQHADRRDALLDGGAQDVLFMPLDRERFLERVGEVAGLKFRTDDRIPLTADVIVKCEGKVHQLRAVDASRGGLRVTGAELPLGATVKIRISMAAGAVEAWGLVARTLTGGETGLRFVGLLPAEEATLLAALRRAAAPDGGDADTELDLPAADPRAATSKGKPPVSGGRPKSAPATGPWPSHPDPVTAATALEQTLEGDTRTPLAVKRFVDGLAPLERRSSTLPDGERTPAEHAVYGAVLARLVIELALAQAPHGSGEVKEGALDDLMKVGESAMAPLQAQLGAAVQAGDLQRLQQVNAVKTSLLRVLSDARACAARLRGEKPEPEDPRVASGPHAPILTPLENVPVVAPRAPRRPVAPAGPTAEEVRSRRVIRAMTALAAVGAAFALGLNVIVWRQTRIRVVDAASLAIPEVLHAEVTNGAALVYVSDEWGKGDARQAGAALASQLGARGIKTALVLDEEERHRASIDTSSGRVDLLPLAAAVQASAPVPTPAPAIGAARP